MISTQLIRKIIIENLLKNPKFLFEQDNPQINSPKLSDIANAQQFNSMSLPNQQSLLGTVAGNFTAELTNDYFEEQITDLRDESKTYSINFIISPVYKFLEGIPVKYSEDGQETKFLYTNDPIIEKYNNLIKAIPDQKTRTAIQTAAYICKESEFEGFSLSYFVAIISVYYHFAAKLAEKSNKSLSVDQFLTQINIDQDLTKIVSDLNQFLNENRKFKFRISSMTKGEEFIDLSDQRVDIYLKPSQFDMYIPKVEDLKKYIETAMQYSHDDYKPREKIPTEGDQIEPVEFPAIENPVKKENETEAQTEDRIEQKLFNLQKTIESFKQTIQTGAIDLLSKDDNQLNAAQKVVKNLIKSAIEQQNQKIDSTANDLSVEEPIQTEEAKTIQLTDDQKKQIDALLKNAEYAKTIGRREQSPNIKINDPNKNLQAIIDEEKNKLAEQEKIKIKNELEQKLQAYYRQETEKVMQEILRNKKIFGEFNPKNLRQELTPEQIEYIKQKMQDLQNNANQLYINYQIAQKAMAERKQRELAAIKSQEETVKRIQKLEQDLKDYNSAVDFNKSININITDDQKVDYSLTPEMQATYDMHMKEVAKQQEIIQNAIKANQEYTQYLNNVKESDEARKFLDGIEPAVKAELAKAEAERKEVERIAKEKIEVEEAKRLAAKEKQKQLTDQFKKIADVKNQAEAQQNQEVINKANEAIAKQKAALEKELETERNANREKVKVAMALAKKKQEEAAKIDAELKKAQGAQGQGSGQGNQGIGTGTPANTNNQNTQGKSTQGDGKAGVKSNQNGTGQINSPGGGNTGSPTAKNPNGNPNGNSNSGVINSTKKGTGIPLLPEIPEWEQNIIDLTGGSPKKKEDELKVVEPIPIDQTPSTSTPADASDPFNPRMQAKDNLGNYKLKELEIARLNIPNHKFIFKIPQLDGGYKELARILIDKNVLIQLKKGGRVDKEFEKKNIKYGYYELNDQEIDACTKWFTDFSKEFLTLIGVDAASVESIQKDMQNPGVIGRILNNYFDNHVIKVNEYLLIDDEFRLYVLLGILIKNKVDISKIEGANNLIDNKNPIVLKSSTDPVTAINKLENKVDLSRRITIQQMFKKRKH